MTSNVLVRLREMAITQARLAQELETLRGWVLPSVLHELTHPACQTCRYTVRWSAMTGLYGGRICSGEKIFWR